MKTKQLIRPLLSLLALVMLTAGCASSRVGKITFDQAIGEFGKPLKTEHVSGNETRVTWLAKEVAIVSTGVSDYGGSVQESITTANDKDWSFEVRWIVLGYFAESSYETHDIPVGGILKGRVCWYKVLTFREDGVLKKEEKTSGIEWNKEGWSDLSAVSNEVISDRWMKNIYANGDVTMSDRYTGLMWLYNANSCCATNWDAAVRYCDDLTYAGYTDWRLPDEDTIAEQYRRKGYFAGVQNGCYWSGMSGVDNTDRAWVGDMNGPARHLFYKTSSNYVWPVRGGR